MHELGITIIPVLQMKKVRNSVICPRSHGQAPGQENASLPQCLCELQSKRDNFHKPQSRSSLFLMLKFFYVKDAEKETFAQRCGFLNMCIKQPVGLPVWRGCFLWHAPGLCLTMSSWNSFLPEITRCSARREAYFGFLLECCDCVFEACTFEMFNHITVNVLVAKHCSF